MRLQLGPPACVIDMAIQCSGVPKVRDTEGSELRTTFGSDSIIVLQSLSLKY